jgi:hypothetical protein
MKKGILLLLPVLILAFAGSAWATHFCGCETDANCDGWSMSGCIYFGEHSIFDATLLVELYEGSTLIESYTQTVPYEGYENDVINFDFSGSWTSELCGTYRAVGTYSFTWGPYFECAFDSTFTCDCPGDEGGCGTPGYWKNWPELWPVSSWNIGCVTFSTEDFHKIFKYPTRGDIRVILAKHLIAAYFNYSTGGGTGIADAIEDGKAYLCEFGYTVGTHRPGGTVPEKGSADFYRGEAIKDELATYNQTCPPDTPEGPMLTAPMGPQLNSGSQESKSWGAIKEIYKK